MKSTLAAVVVLVSVQLAVGVPLTDQLFANNGDNTTKHWEIVPRDKTTKHWEKEPRGETTKHWEIPEILPRDQNQDSLKNSEMLLTEEPPFEGGNGTVPPGAINDGNTKDIIMVPFELVEGFGSLPPGAVNDGNTKDISMVPFELVEGFGSLPPGADNDSKNKEIIMVPFELVKGAVNDDEIKEISMVPYELEDSKGTIPQGALNEENGHKIPPTNVPEGPWTTNVSEGPWVSGQGTPPPGALNDGSSNPFMRGARFLLRAFGF